MKTFFTFLLLALTSQVSFADTTEVERILFDGTSTTETVNLTTEKTKTEYRVVEYWGTCYRTDVRRVCEPTRRHCRTICQNGRCYPQCRTTGGYCRDVLRTVPYSCLKRERRAYQVFDHYVETTADFSFSSDNAVNANENFTIKVTGDQAELSVKSSRNYIIVLDKKSRTQSRSGDTKYVNLSYKIKFIDTAKSSDVVKDGIRNVKLRSGILYFTLGAGFNFDDFTQQIRIYRNKRLASDRLILDTLIKESTATVQSTANSTDLSIDLNNLGVDIPSKIRVILDTKYKIDESKVMNLKDMDLSASANWVFR